MWSHEKRRDRIEDEACGNSLIGYLLNIIAWHSLSNDPIFANETKGGHCIKNHQGSCTPSVYPGEYVCSWLKSSLVTCEQALRGSPVAGQEKEVELATISLEIFEYLHWKCQCKMLIGRDDISKDVITLGACLHVFFNVCSHSCWFPLCADWWKSDSSVDVEPLGNWRQNLNFRDIHVVVSSPSVFLPWCQRPRSACSQATSVTSRQSTVSPLKQTLSYSTHSLV